MILEYSIRFYNTVVDSSQVLLGPVQAPHMAQDGTAGLLHKYSCYKRGGSKQNCCCLLYWKQIGPCKDSAQDSVQMFKRTYWHNSSLV